MAPSAASQLKLLAHLDAGLRHLLERAKAVKPEAGVEPPLRTSELAGEIAALHDVFDETYDESLRCGLVDTAAREVFYDIEASADVSDPAFVSMWNLFDILMEGGEQYICSPETASALIEELLDSQTTDGCRIVFEYLETRQARIAAKDFHRKNQNLLRSCNELLRRLSRAEDAVFCGRVFFFLFLTFPLGDKSSVNLRGDFHVENTTKFDAPGPADGETGDQKPIVEQDVSTVESTKVEETPKPETSQPTAKPATKAAAAKAVKNAPQEALLSNDELYPIFWNLQQSFSQPTRLFAPENLQAFKKGLEHTMTKFKKTPTVVQTKVAEDRKRGVKRKLHRDDPVVDGTDQSIDHYNPKYLTSRELFDLELSDLAFQRHIMVQALILLDFMLSLTEKAKKKIVVLEAELKTRAQETQEKPALNKSVLYSYTLSKEDTEWATATRTAIKTYLISAGPDGRMFDRMVDTVLTRDKNWVRWKMESCPSIVREPVSGHEEMAARKGARDASKQRRVADRVPGAIVLSFLEDGAEGGLEALKDPARYTAPSVQELLDGVKNDKLDLEMAMDDEEKASLQNAIDNKAWRALRRVRESNLDLLDRVEPGKDLEEILSRPAGALAEDDQAEHNVIDDGTAVTGAEGAKTIETVNGSDGQNDGEAPQA